MDYMSTPKEAEANGGAGARRHDTTLRHERAAETRERIVDATRINSRAKAGPSSSDGRYPHY